MSSKKALKQLKLKAIIVVNKTKSLFIVTRNHKVSYILELFSFSLTVDIHNFPATQAHHLALNLITSCPISVECRFQPRTKKGRGSIGIAPTKRKKSQVKILQSSDADIHYKFPAPKYRGYHKLQSQELARPP